MAKKQHTEKVTLSILGNVTQKETNMTLLDVNADENHNKVKKTGKRAINNT